MWKTYCFPGQSVLISFDIENNLSQPRQSFSASNDPNINVTNFKMLSHISLGLIMSISQPPLWSKLKDINSNRIDCREIEWSQSALLILWVFFLWADWRFFLPKVKCLDNWWMIVTEICKQSPVNSRHTFSLAVLETETYPAALLLHFWQSRCSRCVYCTSISRKILMGGPCTQMVVTYVTCRRQL